MYLRRSMNSGVGSSKESWAAYMRTWRAENLDRARRISRKGSEKHRRLNLELSRKRSRECNQRMRDKIEAFFGDKCVRCGFNDPRALQLDHINGNGAADRRGRRGWNLWERYRFIRDKPEEARAQLQLLCANCNCIKRVENGEHGYRGRPQKVDE